MTGWWIGYGSSLDYLIWVWVGVLQRLVVCCFSVDLLAIVVWLARRLV